MSFPGLRQILFEPESRVRISEDRPESDRSAFTLSAIQLSNATINDRLRLTEERVELNPALVTIIGGKGHGKTALLDLIATSYRPLDSDLRQSPGSFVSRILPDNPDIETSLTFRNGETWTSTLTDEEGFGRSRVTYLPQGRIEELSSNTEQLHEFITGLMFKNQDVQGSGLIDKYHELRDHESAIVDQVATDLASIEAMHREASNDEVRRVKNEIDAAKGRVDDFELRLKESTLAEDARQETEELGTKISNLETRVEELNRLGASVDELQSDVSDIGGLNSRAAELGARLSEVGWEGQIPAIDVAASLAGLGDAKRHLGEVHSADEATLEGLRTTRTGLEEGERHHAELLQAKSDELEEIERLEVELARLQTMQANASELLQKCKERYIDGLSRLHERRDVYDTIIETFTASKGTLLESVGFEAKVAFDRSGFEEQAQDLYHGRSLPAAQTPDLADALEELGRFPSDAAARDGYFELMQKTLTKLKPTRTVADFHKLLFRPSFALETDIYFDEKPLSKLSMGQKGTVLLTLFLSEGDHLLLLDQPEENLDNRFVYDVLVPAIRGAKQRRQIIMATHNANLVVNTDSEQVIVAKYDDGTISYKAGALEDPEIRSEVTTLLEGGERAFMQRERRYHG